MMKGIVRLEERIFVVVVNETKGGVLVSPVAKTRRDETRETRKLHKIAWG